jgi:hypothetical protein
MKQPSFFFFGLLFFGISAQAHQALPLWDGMLASDSGVTGSMDIGNIPKGQKGLPILQLRVGGAYHYRPWLQCGAGVEVTGSYLKGSSSLNALHLTTFGRWIQHYEQNQITYLGLRLRIEEAQVQLLTPNNAAGQDQLSDADLEFRELVRQPVLALEWGGSALFNPWWAYTGNTQVGIDIQGTPRAEVQLGLGLQLKEAFPDFFKEADGAYTLLLLGTRFPNASKNPSLHLTIGFSF